jgi:hypothetical protein
MKATAEPIDLSPSLGLFMPANLRQCRWFGQTFTTSSLRGSVRLDSFEFFLAVNTFFGSQFPELNQPFDVKGYVAEWNDGLVGSVLHSTAPVRISTLAGPQQGGIPLGAPLPF